ncbi:MAG TPA: 23S rRNA (pseudouridine(1915)-N(3))-methyltransferase RlmH [Chromatiales bacterium]|nr:23S rRNA (pseudouridine(1915)-N(3))-methyltransferase RlmH [Chromatiales bacterium]
MRIVLLAVGNRMPDWIDEGFETYRKRLPRQCELQLTEIPAVRRRSRADAGVAKVREGERLLKSARAADRVIALDERGSEWTTSQLAGRLQDWQQTCSTLALLIGGPDGLSDDCLAASDERWSLSRLTLPHALVRVLVAEQLYRAWTLLQGHPYHRD